MFRALLDRLLRSSSTSTPASTPTSTPASTSESESGRLDVGYAPRPDGRPDPGEIVWMWVPFEDDPSQGKDRPVLIIGRRGAQLFGLQLTSKDHDFDEAQEARHGRFWFDIGTGPWDRQRRPSEVRLNRLIPINPSDVRREGAVLDQRRFEQVVLAAGPYLP